MCEIDNFVIIFCILCIFCIFCIFCVFCVHGITAHLFIFEIPGLQTHVMEIQVVWVVLRIIDFGDSFLLIFVYSTTEKFLFLLVYIYMYEYLNKNFGFDEKVCFVDYLMRIYTFMKYLKDYLEGFYVKG